MNANCNEPKRGEVQQILDSLDDNKILHPKSQIDGEGKES
jgi:hypothetical protein